MKALHVYVNWFASELLIRLERTDEQRCYFVNVDYSQFPTLAKTGHDIAACRVVNEGTTVRWDHPDFELSIDELVAKATSGLVELRGDAFKTWLKHSDVAQEIFS